ncbi:MAG: translation initiation factor IF-2 [Acidimicrobiia bacterium]|nr:translation initiation factor IF-2 [Acidimicrobiia bacterium]
MPRGSTIQELAPRLNRTAADLVRLLFDAGEMVTGTQSLADEMVELIAEELGAEVLLVEPGAEQELELAVLLGDDEDEEIDESLLEARPPIITVLGHVDHGKTTLLDKIRESDVVGGEAGGITQHIGAYQVERDSGAITFIDTPGHEAFTAMRARGAEVTDVVILVVAADDGVMPQTVEAISHAKAAEVPIIVAVTKVDRDDADPQRVRQQLAEHELVPEEWGGDIIVNDVSAITGDGVESLLDSLLLVAEVEDLRADPKAPARAVVLESHLDQGRGPVATVVVERGTIRRGDQIVAGPAWGKVRALFNDQGERVDEAGPSVPVEVLGLDDTPLAGDELRVAPDDKTARTVADARARRRRAEDLRHPAILAGGARLEDIFAMVQRGEVATLNLLLKADMQGSLEALTDALKKLDKEHEEVRLSFVHRGVGGITESDINLAAVSTATVIGFNVRPDRKARELAETEGVDIRSYEVIYKVLEEVEQALVGMLAPEFEEVVTGKPRSGRSSGFRGSERSQAAMSRTASSPVGRACASCATARSSGRARSRRSSVSRTTPARCRPASSAASASRTSRI